MPTSETQAGFQSTLLTGVSGAGKSTIAYYAPQPIATLLLDKNTIDLPPGVDGSQVWYKTYPPAAIDLSNDDHGRARNIADAIIADVQLLRDHFMAKKPLKVRMFDKTEEEWPTPKTIVLEGGDFLAQHMMNLICARHSKKNPMDWGADYFAPWMLRLTELHLVYDQLAHLPCNLVITTGLHKVMKTVKGPDGKKASEETGEVMPDLGGKMCEEGPRKFASSLYVYTENGKYYVRTRSNAKYRGFKLSGRFGEQEIVDITLDAKKPTNLWDKLFRR